MFRSRQNDAYEKKVRPIYDALDSRNWKNALKLCQQALAKYPGDDLVRVLKAIGLDRSGQREEANEVVDEVLAGKPAPVDEQVLRLAGMVLRGSGRVSAITAMYEAAADAAARMPGGGELALALLHEVFGAHVRESSFVKQQQVALRLSKAAAAAPGGTVLGAERYGWWVVLSLLLQARAALRARAAGSAAPAGQVPAVAMEPEKVLALAEGMMARQMTKDGRLEGYEALMLYVDVLLAQGKVSAAQDLVSGPHGASCLRLPAERLQLQAVLAALAGDIAAGAALLREGLSHQPDDWGALCLLLDCMLPGTAPGASGAAGSSGSPAAFTPRHPLILISGGLAEQLPPRGAPVPADGGASPEAFERAKQAIQDLVVFGAAAATPQPAPKAEPPAPAATAAEAGAGAVSAKTGSKAAVKKKAAAKGKGGGTADAHEASGSGVAGSEAGPSGADGGKAEGSSKPMVMRGPDLALVELALRRHLASSPSAAGAGAANGSVTSTDDQLADSEAAVVEAIMSYYRKHGSLVSCAVDLRSYVSQLSEAGAAVLVAALTAEAELGTDGAAAAVGSVAELRRRVCAAQLLDDAGLPALRSEAEAMARSRELMQLFSTARPLQVGLDERERGAADELPVLAAAALVTAATLAPSDAAAVPHMLAAYSLLNDAVQHRPYSAGMRISLAALAALLGAPSASHGHLAKLELKHIQLDSLGSHLLLPPLLAWPLAPASGPEGPEAPGAAGEPLEAGKGLGKAAPGGEAALVRALRDSRALFDDHSRDAGETIFTAYNHGMYTKVLEFAAFRERLAASHTLAVVRAEAAITDCLRPAAAAASSLRFNADLSVRPAWLPPCPEGPSCQPLEWWRARERGQTRGQGYGRRWWSATSSAEGPSSQAAQWRETQAAAAAHRWLLPSCIAGALREPGQGAPQLREAVERMRASLSDGTNGQAGQTDGATSAAAALPGSKALRRLDVQLYGAALAVQECLASWTGRKEGAEAPAAVPNSAVACSSLSSAAAELAAVTVRAATCVAAAAQAAGAWGGVLPGGWLALLSHLLREPLAVAAACLQSWRTLLAAARKRRSEAGGALEASAQELEVSVGRAAGELAAAARAAGEALAEVGAVQARAGEPATAAAQAVGFLQGEGHAPAALTDVATASLAVLIAEQRATAAALRRQAEADAAALMRAADAPA
ncbi:hypothetical protein GPECTOR_29g5 [Gonium pectorale]|uniref:Uncharacterized protein n=1 Tax=Gonium pectorale TaxID=33097 RepID=A0A150GEL0_GONPE|nr:hypothetical protein GPECTOR_29g5 [Gonium pectorale]|eukprot:KXZ48272.1 hypothetical protein GPECTOR_29g5 [Gonium pectorale]